MLVLGYLAVDLARMGAGVSSVGATLELLFEFRAFLFQLELGLLDLLLSGKEAGSLLGSHMAIAPRCGAGGGCLGLPLPCAGTGTGGGTWCPLPCAGAGAGGVRSRKFRGESSASSTWHSGVPVTKHSSKG